MSFLILALLAGVAAAVVVLAMGLLKTPVTCPRCDQQQPRFRIPRDRQQAAQGGWTCSNCGCQIDRFGQARPNPAA